MLLNNGRCFSFATRLLGCSFGMLIWGSILGAVLPFCRIESVLRTSSRLALARRPANQSRILAMLITSQSMTFSVIFPVTSITRNQDRPVNNVIPTNIIEKRNKVEPSMPVHCSRGDATTAPITPPPLAGMLPTGGSKCISLRPVEESRNRASPVMIATTSIIPASDSASFLLHTRQPA